MNIEIIGWGDTPTRNDAVVNNDQVLELIKEQLSYLLNDVRFVDNRHIYEANLAKVSELSGQMITDKIGVVTRQYYPDSTSYELAVTAARRAIEKARANDPNFSIDKIALVVFGSSSSDHAYPGGDAYAQDKLGLGRVEGVAFGGACCSGTEAMVYAYRTMTLSPQDYPYALVLTGEVTGSQVNAFENEDATIWGDGGGALILRSNLKGDPALGFLGAYGRVDGSNGKYEMTRSDGQGVAKEHRHLRLDSSMRGRGREIFRAVVGEIPADYLAYLERKGLSIATQDLLLPHNGNLHMITSHGEKLGLGPQQICHRIYDRGNQSSASVISTYSDFADRNTFESAETLWFDTFGAGLKWWLVTYRQP